MSKNKKEKVRLNVRISPGARRTLEHLAGGKRDQGAVLDELLLAQAGQDFDADAYIKQHRVFMLAVPVPIYRL